MEDDDQLIAALNRAETKIAYLESHLAEISPELNDHRKRLERLEALVASQDKAIKELHEDKGLASERPPHY